MVDDRDRLRFKSLVSTDGGQAMLKDQQDAFGHGMYDYFNGIEGAEIAERDDGYIDQTGGPAAYFTPYRKWFPIEKKAMKYVRGRVLDVGCGAGRQSLYLQEKGHDVVGIDNSPLAIEVCKKRGLRDARIIPITQIGSTIGIFDTILLFGNNFGLFGTPTRAERLLKRLHKMTSKQGRIIAVSSDIYKTDDPDHLAYHAANRARGRISGQLRFKIRYKRYVSAWFDWLLVSKKEMESILKGTGWVVSRYIDSDAPQYIAIIDKKKA